jgi:hypothetical protein
MMGGLAMLTTQLSGSPLLQGLSQTIVEQKLCPSIILNLWTEFAAEELADRALDMGFNPAAALDQMAELVPNAAFEITANLLRKVPALQLLIEPRRTGGVAHEIDIIAKALGEPFTEKETPAPDYRTVLSSAKEQGKVFVGNSLDLKTLEMTLKDLKTKGLNKDKITITVLNDLTYCLEETAKAQVQELLKTYECEAELTVLNEPMRNIDGRIQYLLKDCLKKHPTQFAGKSVILLNGLDLYSFEGLSSSIVKSITQIIFEPLNPKLIGELNGLLSKKLSPHEKETLEKIFIIQRESIKFEETRRTILTLELQQ